MKSPMSRRRFVQLSVAAATAAPFVARGAESAGFEIGLVADAQYADVEPKGTRYYRQSVGRLGAAVEEFNRRPLAFCVHLGDLIDREWRSFEEILKPLGASRHRFHQILGNHDFDVLEELKPKVPARMEMPERYRFFDHREFRFVFLDTTAVSTYATQLGSPEHGAASAELKRLEGAKLRQAKSWNGGLGAAQIAWLDRTCQEAAKSGRKVIMLAHHPVAPENEHNAWDADQVLALVKRHRNVVAWFNGHNHAGAFAESDGVPFVTMRGMVETPDTSAFATARILSDRIVFAGHGREPSWELRFRPSA